MAIECFELPSSAITTWSGFLYQGQIAILHCMVLLEEKWNLEYSLQLDSLEDFAIVKVIDENITPISMHQVKALKSQSYGKYTIAFGKLNKKSSQCDELYFHIARRINNKTIDEIQENYSNIKIYKYFDDSFNCELGEVQTMLEVICRKVYLKHFPNKAYKQSDEYVKKTLHYLTDIIVQAVIEVHRDTHDSIDLDDQLAFDKTINFSEFKHVFEVDLNEHGDKSDYYKSLILQDISRYYQGYCYEYIDEINEKEMIKLNSYIIEIMKFTDENLKEFIKSITPHREFKFNTIKDYKDNGLQKQDMEDVFFEMLKNIKEGNLKTYNIEWNCSQGYCYSPTAISNKKERVHSICKKIIQNGINSDLNLLFEDKTLITEYLNSESIIEDSHLMTLETFLKEETILMRNHIMRIGNIKLIDASKAKEILNEE